MLTAKRLLSYNLKNQNTKFESTRDFVERVMRSLNLYYPIYETKELDLLAKSCL